MMRTIILQVQGIDLETIRTHLTNSQLKKFWREYWETNPQAGSRGFVKWVRDRVAEHHFEEVKQPTILELTT